MKPQNHARSSAAATAATAERLLRQRLAAALLAALLWLHALQFTLHDARIAAAGLRFSLPAAHAQLITDPAAPIRFQPQLAQSSGAGGGIPAVNITAPNANGISLNQYRQFNVDPIGLILNNGTMGGGALLGGQVAPNPNLLAPGARPAGLIVNQVTAQGNPSRIAGAMEVFGQRADVVLANPDGVQCTACGFINTARVTLAGGVPQLLDAPGGAATGFESAAALAYAIDGGRVRVDGAPGADGQPGAGIEGTVGSISLIGAAIAVCAPIHAGSDITLIAGRQLVTQVAPGGGRAGSDYLASGDSGAVGAANAAAAPQFRSMPGPLAQ